MISICRVYSAPAVSIRSWPLESGTGIEHHGYRIYSRGQYLVRKTLLNLGLEHLFSIAGDYTIRWVDSYVRKSRIRVIEEVNELNAGYAADGYARLKGIGALCVTYSAGGLSAANAVAGAYTERVPVVLISGAPSIDQTLTFEQTGFSAHHFISGRDTVRSVFEPVTVATARLDNPDLAPALIDSALIQCITEKRPIYIELPQDMIDQPCEPPQGKLKRARVKSGDGLKQSVNAIAERLATAASPLVWVGPEIDRFSLQDQAERLIRQLNIPFVTEFLCKAVLSEDDALFAGVYDGNSSSAAVQDLVTTSDFILALGVWPTDINWLGLRTGSQDWSAGFAKTSFVSSYTVKWGTFFSPQVALADLIDGLLASGVACKPRAVTQRPGLAEPRVSPSDPISYQGFYQFIQKYVEEDTIVGGDPSLNYFGCMALKVSARGGFRRPIVLFVDWVYRRGGDRHLPGEVRQSKGNGLFRRRRFSNDRPMSFDPNAVRTESDHFRHRQRGQYGVEQWLADASVFQPGAKPTPFYPSCKLHPWDYKRLAEVFGCQGWRVGTYGDLQGAVAGALKNLTARPSFRSPCRETSIPANGLWKTK